MSSERANTQRELRCGVNGASGESAPQETSQDARGASAGLGLLHDERAVHPHQRSQWSVNRMRTLFTSADRVEGAQFGPSGPFKNRHGHQRREFQGGLLDREHLPAALVA